MLAAMGFSTGGPDDEEVSTGGDDEGLFTAGPSLDDEVSTGGLDDEEGFLVTGGADFDEEVSTGGADDDGFLVTGGDDEGGLLETGGWDGSEEAPLDLFGDGADVSFFDEGDGGAEAFLDIEPEPCSTGTCGLF